MLFLRRLKAAGELLGLGLRACQLLFEHLDLRLEVANRDQLSAVGVVQPGSLYYLCLSLLQLRCHPFQLLLSLGKRLVFIGKLLL